MNLTALLFALISPFMYGLMNVLDKYVVSKKIKHALSFAFLAGISNLIYGVLLAFFLDWNGITIGMLFYPILAGLVDGLQFYLYYFILGETDASNVIGFIYFYPIIVAILSFLFLNEILSYLGYIGVGLVLLGIALLTLRMVRLNMLKKVWMIIALIFIIGIYEFLIKISTTKLPVLNGAAVSIAFIGVAVMPMLLFTKIREGISFEIANFKWALINESLSFFAILTLYLAMAGLPATIVASIAATQPLAVLLIEKIFYEFGVDLCKDPKILQKLVPIILIVIGVVFLSI